MSRAGLFRRLEDLGNELAYIDSYPERWPSMFECAVRRIEVIREMVQVRAQLVELTRMGTEDSQEAA